MILIGAELSYHTRMSISTGGRARDVALKPRQMKELSLLLLTSVAGFCERQKSLHRPGLSDGIRCPCG